MIQVIKSKDRGYADHGWLKSFHTFSFADYYDPARMGFGLLRVINEDIIAPGTGFPTHPHKDMEIFTFMIEGELKHKDSMGNEAVIKPYEVQRMSAGTGVRHSEFNNSTENSAHLLQIWILPEKKDIEPGYEQKSFKHKIDSNNFIALASPNGSGNGSGETVSINQDVHLSFGNFKKDEGKQIPLNKSRLYWLQIFKGEILVNEQTITAGDGCAISDESEIQIKGQTASEFIFFDMKR